MSSRGRGRPRPADELALPEAPVNKSLLLYPLILIVFALGMFVAVKQGSTLDTSRNTQHATRCTPHSPPIFIMLVLMALVTTGMTGPLLGLSDHECLACPHPLFRRLLKGIGWTTLFGRRPASSPPDWEYNGFFRNRSQSFLHCRQKGVARGRDWGFDGA